MGKTYGLQTYNPLPALKGLNFKISTNIQIHFLFLQDLA
jgi:hypothetical protein